MWGLSVLDVLYEEGDILEEDPTLNRAGIQTDSVLDGNSRPLGEMISKLMRLCLQSGTVSEGMMETAQIDSQFFGKAMEELGTKILGAILARASALDDINFTFFAREALNGTLLPYLSTYYYGREGHVCARQAGIRHFFPLVFTTRKTTYMSSLVWQMELAEKVPNDILECIMSPGGCTTNITGTNPHGNLDDDEANEMTGVRDTKSGPLKAPSRHFMQAFIHHMFSQTANVRWRT